MSRLKISLLLPTRGRSYLLNRLLESISDYSCDINHLEIVLYLDNDDYFNYDIVCNRLNIVKNIGPRETMGAYNTSCLKISSGNIIMLMNDDLVVQTRGWDQKIRSVFQIFPDEIFMAYPNDMERANLSTFPIMSRKTCDIIGFPFPKEYESLFIDDHIFDIFIRLKKLGHNRLYYLDDVKLDHRHFIDGKVRPDASYTHKNRYKDYITFISLISLRQICACRLLAAIKGTSLPDLPSSVSLLPPPRNFADAVYNYSAKFLWDDGLPLKLRLLWFIRFTKYFVAMKGGIDLLKAKTYTLYGS